MNTTSMRFDIETLKALSPIVLGIGAALGVFLAAGLWEILGGLWSLLLLIAWAISGAIYAHTLLQREAEADYVNLAVNGATLAAVAEITFDIVSGVILSLRAGTFVSFFSVSTFLEAGIIGAIAAVAWYAYQGSVRGE